MLTVFSILLTIKRLRLRPREEEEVTRSEMTQSLSLRDEQIKTLSLRCVWLEDRVRSLEASTQKRFDELVSALGELRIEMAKLTTLLEAKAKEQFSP